MTITLSVDDEILRQAQVHADALGTSVDRLLLEYLERLSGGRERKAAIEEFERLSLASAGKSDGWKFNREELLRKQSPSPTLSS